MSVAPPALPDVSGMPGWLAWPLQVVAYLTFTFIAWRTGRNVWTGAGEASKKDAAAEADPDAPGAVGAVSAAQFQAFTERQAKEIARLENQIREVANRLARVEDERDALALENRALRGRTMDQSEIISDLLRHIEAMTEWGTLGGAKPPTPALTWRIREALDHERALRRQRAKGVGDDDEDDPP